MRAERPECLPGGSRRTLLASLATLLGSGAGLWLTGCAAASAPATASITATTTTAATAIPSWRLLQAPAATLPGTHQMDMRDPASGRSWRIWLQRPAGPAPATGHPVLYLLDGNASFAIAAQLARNGASRPSALRADPALIIGIGHPGAAVMHPAERQRDYTPPALDGTGAGMPTATAPSGGADVLLDFIARELQPRLAAAFAIDPARQTISGHSFGGLLVLHALLTRPTQFTRYAATSPSVWWNDGQIMATAERFIQTYASAARPFQARLQLRIGSLEGAAAAPTVAQSAARAAVQRERRMLERTQALAAQLGALQWPELRVQMEVLAGKDHGSAMAPGLIDALALAQQPR